jgi:transposase
MTDAEWRAIEPVMPHPAWLHGTGGLTRLGGMAA